MAWNTQITIKVHKRFFSEEKDVCNRIFWHKTCSMQYINQKRKLNISTTEKISHFGKKASIWHLEQKNTYSPFNSICLYFIMVSPRRVVKMYLFLKQTISIFKYSFTSVHLQPALIWYLFNIDSTYTLLTRKNDFNQSDTSVPVTQASFCVFRGFAIVQITRVDK